MLRTSIFSLALALTINSAFALSGASVRMTGEASQCIPDSISLQNWAQQLYEHAAEGYALENGLAKCRQDYLCITCNVTGKKTSTTSRPAADLACLDHGGGYEAKGHVEILGEGCRNPNP